MVRYKERAVGSEQSAVGAGEAVGSRQSAVGDGICIVLYFESFLELWVVYCLAKGSGQWAVGSGQWVVGFALLCFVYCLLPTSRSVSNE